MTKLIAVSLVERPQYGACEFKEQIQVNTRKGTIFSIALLAILLGIYLIIIAQDEESCVVFGMPKKAYECGGAEELVPIEKITDRLSQLIKEKIQ